MLTKLQKIGQKAGMAATTALTFVAPVLAQYSYETSSSSSSDGALGGAFGLFFFCCIFIFALAYLGLKIYLTIDCLNRNYGDDKNGKLLGIVMIWIVDMFIAPFGLVLYYFLVMRKFPKSK